jgi:hypothetical protein
MQLAENTVVAGRFRLNRLIGQGGMGSVWQATHLGLDIPCAVKFIEGEMARVPEMQMRFEREAKAAAQLRSPHVVQILDHGVFEGTPYIAMELLDGEDLGKRYGTMGRMPPAQLHNFMGQVCRALSKAHSLGIVHRDLKPDNIFLVRDDDREIAKVLDFGIAKTSSQELGGSNTKTGAMLGTPYYMSPEQAQGTRALDFRSDLWSLAVITFQGLTGRLPFESEALGDLLMKIMVMELPMPSQLGCTLPGADGWWRKAAARDPAQRFQSAKEFADSLALVCGVSQLSGVHDRPPMMAPGPTGTMALRADGTPALPAAPWQPHHATTPDAQAPAGLTGGPVTRTFGDGTPVAPKKGGAAVAIGLGVVVLGVIGGGAFFALHTRSGAATTASASTAQTPSGAPAATEQPSTAAPPATAGAVADASVPSAPGTGAAATAPSVTASAAPEAPNSPPSPPAATPVAPRVQPAATPPVAVKASGGTKTPPKKPAPADLGF